MPDNRTLIERLRELCKLQRVTRSSPYDVLAVVECFPFPALLAEMERLQEIEIEQDRAHKQTTECITNLQAENAKLRELVALGYKEGYYDADFTAPVTYSDYTGDWEESETKQALEAL